MSNPWENYPLPPNIEKKYDFHSKKFFFINHMDKSTSWEDPRAAYYAQQQRMFTPNFPPKPVQTLAHHPSPQPQRAAQPSGSSLGLTNMNTRSRAPSSDMEETNLDLFLLDDGFSFEIATLQSKFPNIAESEIKSVINKHNGSLDKATRELQTEVDAKNRKQEFENKVKVVCDSFPEFNKDYVSKIMKKHNLIVYKVRDELASTRTKRADCLRVLRMQFHDAKEAVIKDIFEACNYDLNDASKTLKEMGFARPSVTHVPRSTAGQNQISSSSLAAQSQCISQNKPGPEASTASVRSKSPTPVQASTTTNLKIAESAPAKKSAAKQNVKAKPRETKPKSKKVFNRKQTASPAKSEIRETPVSHLAMGPDSHLQKGPNPGLLYSSERCIPLALGADPSLQHGPQSGLQQGSRIRALGHNPLLCKGPDVNLRLSSNPHLIVGSV